MEEWKTVIVNGEIYVNYQVSNLGNVKSLKFGKEKILKPIKNIGNYLTIVLFKDGKRKNCRIHRLVAEAFIPKIEGKNHVDHINGNRQDNRIENLRYCTQAENNNFDLYRKHKSEAMKDKHHTEKTKRKIGEANSKAVLCIELNRIYGSTMEAERELGIYNSSISKCCNGKLKSTGGYHWKYID